MCIIISTKSFQKNSKALEMKGEGGRAKTNEHNNFTLSSLFKSLNMKFVNVCVCLVSIIIFARHNKRQHMCIDSRADTHVHRLQKLSQFIGQYRNYV